MRPINRWLVAMLGSVLMAGCASPPRQAARDHTVVAPSRPLADASPWPARGGGYYQDDGPGDDAPENIDAIADAVPRLEPLHRFANNPYSVLGRDYVPMRQLAPYRARGTGSWYGRKFHGQKTSSGEAYDMYGMTAAHPTLPIPSYVRVSNPANGRSVVVRINDRGPFHADRAIDLSWTAAQKLGYATRGSATVEIELLLPGDSPTAIASKPTDEDPITSLALAPVPVPQPTPAHPLDQARDASGHYLQLGAFGNRDNAEALKARLGKDLGDLAERLVVKEAANVFRVQLGPWPDRASAQRAGERLRESLGLGGLLVRG